MDLTLLELLGSILVLLITCGISYLVHTNSRLKKVEERMHQLDRDKIDHEDLKELKVDIKQVLEEIQKLKLEQVKWQVRAEAQTKKD